ncbi:MAG: hypothetical protein E7218_06015 [Anaerofustis stercorihominis]|nr:hypothetical protein [Anaerofustis stercorihominis]
MIVYELRHIYFVHKDEYVDSCRNLGIFSSSESVHEAIQYYNDRLGFCDNQKAYSIRRREVIGQVTDNIVYEALINPHTEDYEYDYGVELGLFGSESDAKAAINVYVQDNIDFMSDGDVMRDCIVNRCMIDRTYCAEGFTVYEY